MCRLFGYLGNSIRLENLLYKPERSLIVQSYQPLEMTAGLLNADGFGLGWYHPTRQEFPYTYRNILPIWNDINLPSLSRYIESRCVVASVRSATPGLAVDLSNCPPFQQDDLLMVHNGFIENFRHTLYRQIRDRLNDNIYTSIKGTTDSEHLFAMICQEHHHHPDWPLVDIVRRAITQVFELAAEVGSTSPTVGANLILSRGDRLIACRASNRTPAPSLYWLRDDPTFPNAVIIASEPLFSSHWQPVPEQHLLLVNQNLDVDIQPLC